MTRILLAALLSVCLLACPSCGDPREAAIEASFYDLENAMNWEDGDTAVALYSAESFTVCDALLKHALDSDAETVRRLAPSAIGEIFTMRNRCDREQIEQMDGRAWVKVRHRTGVVPVRGGSGPAGVRVRHRRHPDCPRWRQRHGGGPDRGRAAAAPARLRQ